MEWKSFKFKENIVHVKKTKVKMMNNKYYENDTNKNHSTRILAVPVFLSKELEGLQKRRVQIGGKIFTSFTPNACTKRFEDIVKSLSIEDSRFVGLRLHDLRHFNAIVMLKSGIADKVAAQRLGHKQVSTTREIYQHVLEEMDVNAASIIDNSLSGKLKKRIAK